MRPRSSALGLVLVAWACTRAPGGNPGGEGGTVLAQAGRSPADANPGDATAAAGAQLPPGDWVDAVRQQRWADAARLIDALPEHQRGRTEMSYVRARVALAQGEHALAGKLLAKLELPLLGEDVAARRAEAQLEAGPFEPAAAHYAAQHTVTAQTRAALAFERAGSLDKARAAADRAVLLAEKQANRKKNGAPSSEEVEARHQRARILEKQGQNALAAAELRWLAIWAPTSERAKDVDTRLEKLALARVLSARERYDRVMAMAREGRVEQLDRELSLIAGAPGPGITQAERLHARGWALYSARQYDQAAEVLEQASRAGGERAAHDLFHAARARSRAHQDDRAIAMYGEVATRFKKSPYAEQARYQKAHLYYVLGKWGDAASAYDAYSQRHAKDGRFLALAGKERAVALLAAGRHDKAAKAFATLSSQQDSEAEQAELAELEGVALAAAGKKPAAARAFRKVVAARPLSFAALAATTRLSELGEPAPPALEPPKAAPARPSLAVELPPRVRLLHSLGLDADAEQELAQMEESLRRSYAPRGDEALCRMYGQLSEAARRYRVGQRAAQPLTLNREPGSDTRWLWECIYPRPYQELVRSAEQEHQLPPDLVYAVMRQESGFHPRVVSPAKAVGLMQLIPPTAESAARELSLPFQPPLLESPPYNIRLGSYYLSKVLGTFGGNVALAAAAYNAGPGAVSRWLETGEALPLDVWVARIPYPETRQYVSRVVGNMARYAYLAGGDAAVPKLALEIPKGLRAPADAY